MNSYSTPHVGMRRTKFTDRKPLQTGLSECCFPMFCLFVITIDDMYARGVCMQGQVPPQPTIVMDTVMENQRKNILCMFSYPLMTLPLTSHLARKRDKLLKLLDALRCSEKHRQTSSIRQSDTCAWLHVLDTYTSWRQGKGSFLWLQGKGIFPVMMQAFCH